MVRNRPDGAQAAIFFLGQPNSRVKRPRHVAGLGIVSFIFVTQIDVLPPVSPALALQSASFGHTHTHPPPPSTDQRCDKAAKDQVCESRSRLLLYRPTNLSFHLLIGRVD